RHQVQQVHHGDPARPGRQAPPVGYEPGVDAHRPPQRPFGDIHRTLYRLPQEPPGEHHYRHRPLPPATPPGTAGTVGTVGTVGTAGTALTRIPPVNIAPAGREEHQADQHR